MGISIARHFFDANPATLATIFSFLPKGGRALPMNGFKPDAIEWADDSWKICTRCPVGACNARINSDNIVRCVPGPTLRILALTVDSGITLRQRDGVKQNVVRHVVPVEAG